MNTYAFLCMYYIFNEFGSLNDNRIIILNRNHMFTKVISNLLIWMCIREIIFIKRENRTLVSNAFLNLMCMKFEFDIP